MASSANLATKVEDDALYQAKRKVIAAENVVFLAAEKAHVTAAEASKIDVTDEAQVQAMRFTIIKAMNTLYNAKSFLIAAEADVAAMS